MFWWNKGLFCLSGQRNTCYKCNQIKLNTENPSIIEWKTVLNYTPEDCPIKDKTAAAQFSTFFSRSVCRLLKLDHQHLQFLRIADCRNCHNTKTHLLLTLQSLSSSSYLSPNKKRCLLQHSASFSLVLRPSSLFIPRHSKINHKIKNKNFNPANTSGKEGEETTSSSTPVIYLFIYKPSSCSHTHLLQKLKYRVSAVKLQIDTDSRWSANLR